MKIIAHIIVFLLFIGCVNQNNQKELDSSQNINSKTADTKPASKSLDENFESSS